jgi:hypothetical protein
MRQLSLESPLPLALESSIANDKRHQAPIAGIEFNGSRDGSLHSVALPESRLNLSQLDAKATNLNLVIHPPEEVEATVRELDGKIATPVHPGWRASGERIGQEMGVAKIGATQVTQSHPRAANEHFSDRTPGDRLKMFIEEANCDVR